MQRFEQIYVEHREAVRAYVGRRAPADLVDDVVADVFLVCLRRIDEVPSEPLPWLYGVARKTLANERRRRQRTAPADPGVSPAPEPVGDSSLAAAFADLSERDREVLRLVAWEGLALHDAARVLDCSAVAARVRYHRAKSRLAAKLDRAASFHIEPKGVTR
ncbi:MAG TPA: sigma-70 family RNA polymerase sigma factor [Gaiellaceae bacterium]|jgi:RNA polymerase sigma-70 factor (ECF subfamily)|nr:sigma-70 family RNA polymerase sigma factor [Gaiellaceae bacterium]